MSIALNNINNSLIVKSILSPALNLEDTTAVDHGRTQGDVNKKTLLNRVKKMTQTERKEFMGALNELSQRVNLADPLPENTLPLQERGICTLILADDGKAAKTHCFIASFFLGLSNLFGDRVSSAVIMGKIRATRAALISKGYSSNPLNLDPREGLTTTIAGLQLILDTPDRSDRIQPLIDNQWAEIKSKFSIASSQDWSGITTFLPFLASLRTFEDEIDGQIPAEAKLQIDRELAAINEMMTIKTHSSNPKDFATAFLTSENLKDLKEKKQFCNARIENWEWSMDQIAFGKGDANHYVKNFNRLQKDLIVHVVNLRIKLIENALKSAVASSETKKQSIREKIILIQGRLKKFEDNILKSQQKKELSEHLTEGKKIVKELENLKSICELVDFLDAARSKDFYGIRTVLNLAFDQIAHASVPLKRTRHFGEHLALLNRFANGEDTRQNLADALTPDLLNGTELSIRLTRFKSDPTNYDLSTYELKKDFINDYIAYWKIIFDQLKKNKEQELKQLKNTAHRLQTAVASRPQPRSNEPAVLRRSGESVRPVHQPATTTSLPITWSIPTFGNAALIAIATGIQNNRSDPIRDVGFYGQLVPGISLSSDLVNQVYGNFYWIMKDAGKLCDTDPTNGHARHPNWGGEVFTKGKVNGVAPTVERGLLNHYRTQAIVEVLHGRIRSGANQF